MYAKTISCAALLSVAIYPFHAGDAEAFEVDSVPDGVDIKYYNAAGCGALNNNAQIKIRPNGSIANEGTTKNVITCPVIVDRWGPGSQRRYQLLVNRPTGAGAMSCFLTQYEFDGTATTITQSVNTTGADTTVSFTGSGGLLYGVSLGCNMPKKVAAGASAIKLYYASEY